MRANGKGALGSAHSERGGVSIEENLLSRFFIPSYAGNEGVESNVVFHFDTGEKLHLPGETCGIKVIFYFAMVPCTLR